MKTTISDKNETVIRAILSREEVELILARAVLLDCGRTIPDSAFQIFLGDQRNERSGTIEPPQFVRDVVITIDNTQLPASEASAK